MCKSYLKSEVLTCWKIVKIIRRLLHIYLSASSILNEHPLLKGRRTIIFLLSKVTYKLVSSLQEGFFVSRCTRGENLFCIQALLSLLQGIRQKGKVTAFIINCAPLKGISQLHWRIPVKCWEASENLQEMKAELPSRHWKEQVFSPEYTQRDLSGLWPGGQSTGLAEWDFLTGSFVKVSWFLIQPSAQEQSFEIIQKAQDFLRVKVKCQSNEALGKKQASLNGSLWILKVWSISWQCLEVTCREPFRILSAGLVLFSTWNYIFHPKRNKQTW